MRPFTSLFTAAEATWPKDGIEMMKKLEKALERWWAGAVRMMRNEEQEPRCGDLLLALAVGLWQLLEAVRTIGGGVKEHCPIAGQNDRGDHGRECDQHTPGETGLDCLQACHDKQERGACGGGGDQRRHPTGYRPVSGDGLGVQGCRNEGHGEGQVDSGGVALGR